MPPKSNDQTNLTPRTDFDGPVLHFDIPGVLVGVAEYEDGPTGCTVFRFPGGAPTEVDVRGGMVGITTEYKYCGAICLAGGSLMGLEAAAGVTAGIFAEQEYSFQPEVPLVNGAIIYDYGARGNMIYPDKALGRAALEAARPGVFPLGARGVGRSAGVGGIMGRDRAESSGQGGAYRALGEIRLAVFTVVNALGAVVNRAGQVVRGNLDRATGQRGDIVTAVEAQIAAGDLAAPRESNTTLTVLITNLALERRSLTQLGRQVHSSMARAICPFHTLHDGDVFYTVTTGEVKREVSVASLGIVASELAWDAVLSAAGSGRD